MPDSSSKHAVRSLEPRAAEVVAARRILWRCDEGAHVHPRRRQLRPADCVRKRREPAARGRNCAPEGTGASGRGRSATRPADPAAAYREPAAFTRRVRLRTGAGVLGDAALCSSSSRSDSRSCCDTSASTRVCWDSLWRSPIGSSLVFGLLPALRTSRTDLNDVLKEGTRGIERLAAWEGEACSWSPRSRCRWCCSSAPA